MKSSTLLLEYVHLACGVHMPSLIFFHALSHATAATLACAAIAQAPAPSTAYQQQQREHFQVAEVAPPL
jgi:hypothetical protein